MKKISKHLIIYFMITCVALLSVMSGCTPIDLNISDNQNTSSTSTKSEISNNDTTKIIIDKIKKQCNIENMEDASLEQIIERYALKEDYVETASGLINNNSLNMEQAVIVKAKGESEACSIRDSLEKYYKNILDESKSYLPDEYKKIKKCSVVKDGIYITMFISDDFDKMTEIYNSCDKT